MCGRAKNAMSQRGAMTFQYLGYVCRGISIFFGDDAEHAQSAPFSPKKPGAPQIDLSPFQQEEFERKLDED